jgi:hypothetical protein
MKQTLKLIKQTQTQKLSFIGASGIRHQAVAAAFGVKQPFLFTNTSAYSASNTLFRSA